ncbi:XRE family transcriptional regulator [Listeria sp. SHR_NRA_18]|uniref:helix-turn-helix transcriptional regulator n=1 Tax=Listeria sp. SHR_NRA_18 TaxID=2269046 RepID=UPI000F5DBF68|nr:helix-turn-helix transcriptional regulator [Listeria sp. SHR_NRA_18]RQW65677.1 XRE family transcriptional regulator [Listeria sp. SHR_NRA_18]
MKKNGKYTLKQLRAMQGMTQEELAKKTGITTRTIINYESDVSNLRNSAYKTIEKLAVALNSNVDDIFLGGISEKPNQEEDKE